MKNHSPWSDEQTNEVILLKNIVKDLPCLGISNPDYFMNVETDASNISYGGIIRQRKDTNSSEQLVRHTS